MIALICSFLVFWCTHKHTNTSNPHRYIFCICLWLLMNLLHGITALQVLKTNQKRLYSIFNSIIGLLGFHSNQTSKKRKRKITTTTNISHSTFNNNRNASQPHHQFSYQTIWKYFKKHRKQQRFNRLSIKNWAVLFFVSSFLNVRTIEYAWLPWLTLVHFGFFLEVFFFFVIRKLLIKTIN